MRLLEWCGTFDVDGVSFGDRLLVLEIDLVYFFGAFVFDLVISTFKKNKINIKNKRNYLM